MSIEKNLTNFWEASDEALFDQKLIANALQFSEAKLERDRWKGEGIPFLKLGKSVRYRKRDVLQWLNKQAFPATSTSQYQITRGNSNDTI